MAPFQPRATSSRLPFVCASVLLFTHFARPFDTVLAGYRLPAIICSIAIVAAVLSGGLRELRSRVGFGFLLLLGWMCFTVPFSSWKGGSSTYVLWYLQFYLPLMLLVAVASKTPGDIVKLSGVLAFSCLFHLIVNGSWEGDRLTVAGTYGNSGEVALLAGFTIPFFLLAVSRLRAPLLRYFLIIGCCGFLLLLIGRTGTRAAIPSLAAMVFVYIIRSRGVQRLAIIAFVVVAAFAVALALPANTIGRLSTLFDDLNGQSVHLSNAKMSEAEASTLERRDLMVDALKMTLAHPLVGVGAGMFTQYRWEKLLQLNGQHKPYLPAHATYLQISSECGIPGVIVYLIFLGSIYVQVRATRKVVAARATANADMLWSVALCIEAALAHFAVNSCFITCDRYPHQFVLAGFAIAMQRLSRGPLAETPAAVPRAGFSFTPVPFVGKRAFPVRTR